MRTVEEVANEIMIIVKKHCEDCDYSHYDPTEEIAQALTAYAEERNVCCWDQRSPCNVHAGAVQKVRAEALAEVDLGFSESYEAGRAEGLEDAAKIASKAKASADPLEIAKAIRALGGKA